MKYLKQRQVLGYVNNDETQPVYIDRHFGDDIEALMAKVLATQTATTTPAASQTSPDTLTALLNALQLDLVSLMLRVATLEKGYQS